MFLRSNKRIKNGKSHRYWNIVENRRAIGGRIVQKQVLYLGEITDNQQESWRKAIEVFDEGDNNPKQMFLFPDDQARTQSDIESIQIRLNDITIKNPRQWGACWLFCELWDLLGLDKFWRDKLKPGRKGTNWLNIFKILTAYRLVESEDRIIKERSMRRRRLKKLCKRLEELQKQHNSRDQLLLKIGAAKKEAGRAYSLLYINLPNQKEVVNEKTFTFSLNKNKLREAMKREGKYILRSNLTTTDPGELWKQYMLLTEVEQAFKELKGDLSIRPIHHQNEDRIQAHIFVAFQAYCINVTLKEKLKRLAPGLTPRAVIEKFKKIQMVDVHLPTTDNRNLLMSRYTQPEKEHKILLEQMNLKLPKQLPPTISTKVG